MSDNQLDKFKDAAKEAECDLDEAKFDEALGKLARPPEASTLCSPDNDKVTPKELE